MDTLLDSGPKLLLDLHEPGDSSRILRAGVGSILVHIFLFSGVTVLGKFDNGKHFEPIQVAAVKHYTPLIAPPMRLTQKEANKAKVAKEVRLDNLLAKPDVKPRLPSPPVEVKRQFQAPPANPLPPAPKPAEIPPPPEPPKLEASAKPPQMAPPSILAIQPPQIQPDEKPKLAFETPGQNGNSPIRGGSQVKIPIPKPTIDDAVRSVARGGGSQGGVAVGDAEQVQSLRDSLRHPAAPGRTQSRLELLSDPMGVDFKPYLIRILATVRRNWFSVIPESAHMGRHGTVSLQFSIDRSGQVPKLVIAMPSGAEALDRAAVAGISASVPFPPLPSEFKGKQIVLQFSFQYN